MKESITTPTTQMTLKVQCKGSQCDAMAQQQVTLNKPWPQQLQTFLYWLDKHGWKNYGYDDWRCRDCRERVKTQLSLVKGD